MPRQRLPASPERAKARKQLRQLRLRLEKAFSSDTAAEGLSNGIPSSGHCAVAAVVLQSVFGGSCLSARVNGVSHWFNRFHVAGLSFDADITGDQFGLPPVQIAPAESLYPGARPRSLFRMDVTTLCRARLLAERAGLAGPWKALSEMLYRRAASPDLWSK